MLGSHPATCACKASHLGADWAEDQVVDPFGRSCLCTALVAGAASVSLCPAPPWVWEVVRGDRLSLPFFLTHF